jgi:spermidine synthase
LLAEHLRDFLPAVKSVLILGAGLGSLVQVLRAHGHDPFSTLVEKDTTVLQWAREVLGESPKLELVRRDAESFMGQNRRRYDLVFVDVFKARSVPDFVTTPAFLGQCREALTPGGRLALNYIVQDDRSWQGVHKGIQSIFPGCETIESNDNRIVIGQPKVTDGSGQPDG